MPPHLEQRLEEIADRECYEPASEYVHAMRLGAMAALEWMPIDSCPVDALFLACDAEDYTSIELLSWQGCGRVWNYGSNNVQEIKHYTHWMPMPPPPKEPSDE